jgi:hypothetical protein
MRKLTKKLFLSILSVALAVVALGTTTFAWFTLGNEVTVGQISAEIVADEGIEISLGNTGKWYTSLSASNVSEYITANAINNELDNIAMSSLATTDTKAFAFTNAEGQSTSKYLQLEIKVRYSGEIEAGNHATLYLKTAQFDSSVTNWVADTTITNAKTVYNLTAGVAKAFYASDAARLTLSTGTASGYLFTCQAYGHTVNDTYTAINYGEGNDKISSAEGTASTGFAQLYAASKNYEINALANDADLTTLTPAENYTSSNAAIGNFTSAVDTLTFYTTIWLDGWDDECINAIIEGIINLKLEFAVTAVVED